MPVAVPLISNPSTVSNPSISVTDNGIFAREFDPVDFIENEGEGEDYSEDEEDEEDCELDTDDNGGGEGYDGESYLPRNSGLFEEYFDDEPTVTSRERICNHQATSRPCPFCAPKVSMRLANEMRIAFKALFDSKVMKFNYIPLDKSLVESSFKAIKALHDLGYIKRILNEIINLLVTIQNIPDIKMSYLISSAIMRIHDRIEGIIDEIRSSGKRDELQLVLEFRMRLNSIGIIQGGVGKENIMYGNYLQHQVGQECQR